VNDHPREPARIAMATRKATADFILKQLGLRDRFSVRAMFGEFALYADGKVVGLICDDQLYVKIMPESKVLERQCEPASPFPGAKAYHLVPEDLIAGDASLAGLLLRMATVLPAPRKKVPRRS
jgi:TfoX/Sxy family transcriptional regulator of competence genes